MAEPSNRDIVDRVREGREQLVVDAVTGGVLSREIIAPLPGGVIPPPHDAPCGPRECDP